MQEIADKVRNGVPLDKEDGLFLYNEAELLDVGQLAREVKLRKSGKHVFFNVNCHINLTNICMSRCKFCAFGVDEDGEGGPYLMSVEEAFDYGSREADSGITEFHIVSALHPQMPLSIMWRLLRDFTKPILIFIFKPSLL